MQSSAVCRGLLSLTVVCVRLVWRCACRLDNENIASLTQHQQAAFAAPVSERTQPFKPPSSQVSLGSDTGPMQSSMV
jgi:hypothetical protein